MEMHQIRYFLAVARTLNFTQAADECNVAQPSLTRAIKKLESEFGGDLFRRERSRTHLTELGRAMLPMLTQSYESAVAAQAHAEGFNKAAVATLRIGLSKSVGIEILSLVLGELTATFSNLEVKLVRATAAEIEQLLSDGEIELALTGIKQGLWDRIDCWSLFTEDFVAVVPNGHALAGAGSVAFEELNNQDFIARPYCEQAAQLNELVEHSKSCFRTVHDVSNENDLAHLVSTSMGMAIVPRSFAKQTDEITLLPLDNSDLTRTVTLFAVAGRQYSKTGGLMVKMMRAADWSGLATV
jgi:DNA-binding transcriptional LysR family regulator